MLRRKHVPLMNQHRKTVTNNVIGTQNVVNCALTHDAAAGDDLYNKNPTDQRDGRHQTYRRNAGFNTARLHQRAFTVVRFGNVGSGQCGAALATNCRWRSDYHHPSRHGTLFYDHS